MRVAILAKGPSLALYPGREIYDDVWGLNQTAKTHDLDLLFVMDDLKLRMPAWDPEFPNWLKTYGRPIITSRAYDEWRTSIAFPLTELVGSVGLPLGLALYSTVDAMLAYGILRRVTRMDLYGVDCNQPKREERERVSIAMWIAVAQARGIQVTVQPGSFFQWYTHTGTAHEHGCYGYAGPPRIEELYATQRNNRLGPAYRYGVSVTAAVDPDGPGCVPEPLPLLGVSGLGSIEAGHGHLHAVTPPGGLLADVAVTQYRYIPGIRAGVDESGPDMARKTGVFAADRPSGSGEVLRFDVGGTRSETFD